MNSRQKRQLKQKQIETISDEERTEIHKILNEFISKNRTKHFRILNKRFIRVFGGYADPDVVEDMLQNIYVYMYLSPDKVKEFYSTGHLDRLFNTLVYHKYTLMNISQSMNTNLPLSEDIDIPCEESIHSCSFESLCPEFSNEERLEYHRIALDELREYLLDNPQSNLKKALEMTKNTWSESTCKVAINYCATPSYKFLRDNAKELGLKNVQHNLEKFKEICSKVYGKEVVWNGQSAVKHF